MSDQEGKIVGIGLCLQGPTIADALISITVVGPRILLSAESARIIAKVLIEKADKIDAAIKRTDVGEVKK